MLFYYSFGVYMGIFCAGALYGTIAMLVLFCFRHFISGLLCPIICGLIGFISSIASMVAAAILLILSIILVTSKYEKNRQKAIEQRKADKQKAAMESLKAEQKAAMESLKAEQKPASDTNQTEDTDKS